MVFKGQDKYQLEREREREKLFWRILFFFLFSINIKVYLVDFKDYSLKGKLLVIIEYV